MSEEIQDDPIPELRRALCGNYRLDLAHGLVRVRIRPLPDHLVAAGAVEGDHMWLFIDREKPGAMGHARELLATHPELIVHAPGECPFAVTRTALYDEEGVAELILGSGPS